MECTGKKELVDQSYEILVHVPGPNATIPARARLRFALEGSTWLPKSVRILVWSALHVLLVVGGAPVLVFATAACMVCAWLFGVLYVALSFLFFMYWAFCALFGVVILFFWVLIMLIWSLVHGSGCLDYNRAMFRSVAKVCGALRTLLAGNLRCLINAIALPTKLSQGIFNDWFRSWWREWVGWCEEVVHMHDTVVI